MTSSDQQDCWIAHNIYSNLYALSSTRAVEVMRRVAFVLRAARVQVVQVAVVIVGQIFEENHLLKHDEIPVASYHHRRRRVCGHTGYLLQWLHCICLQRMSHRQIWKRFFSVKCRPEALGEGKLLRRQAININITLT